MFIVPLTGPGFIPHYDSKTFTFFVKQSVLTTVFPLFSPTGFFEMKMKYDESDNAVIRASRVVTDKVTDFLGNAPPSLILLLHIVLVVELKKEVCIYTATLFNTFECGRS